MNRRFVLTLLALSLTTRCWADEEYIKVLVSSIPEGAVVRLNNRELGRTGVVFDYPVAKIPESGTLQLQLYLDDFQPEQLVMPLSSLLMEGKEVVEFPKSAIQMSPANFRGWLKLNRVWVAFVSLVLAGAGALGLRNRQLGQQSQSRDAQVNRLKDQITAQHEFALTKIGPYRILEQLGEGGIAKVYRAVPDETLDESKAIAVKILHPHLCKDGDHSQRFIREGRVSKDLIHPNIIRLFEIESDGDLVYLALELLKGQTLRDRIRQGTIPLGLARRLLSQIFAALVYAHQKGVVHRDLTPSNIMVCENTQVKLMDFGLARRREMGHTITVTGVVQGTPGYMAPEQLKEELDARSDQYSLGVIMYEMLTGRRPIERSDPLQQIMATYTEDAPDPREINPEIPRDISELILKMLRRNPEDRFASMQEAADAFEQAFRDVRTTQEQ